MARVD
jgi:energy-coupling factor transporter ATP-binding protein EcfA2